MNMLITGELSCLSATLARVFLREGDHVVLVGQGADVWKTELPKVSCYSVSPSAENYHEIIAAHTFDAVIYLATREEHLLDGDQMQAGQALDGLLVTLERCRQEGIGRIFYISSTEVYGNEEFPQEDKTVRPASPNGFSLETGEQYCLHYSRQYGLSPMVIRSPFIYGQGETGSFLHSILKKCTAHKKVVFPGGENTLCSFLHAEDIADFILRSLDEPGAGFQVVNLSSADPLTFGQLAELLKGHFPEARFEFDLSRHIFTRPALVQNAKRYFDWTAEHLLRDELPGIIEEVSREPRPKTYLIERIRNRFPRFATFLQWFEVFTGAIFMHYFSGLSGAVFEFRYVDFRLAYVILLGSVYGTQMGIVAASLATLSMLVYWSTLNLEWVELLYNVSNWLPFAVYLTAGVVTGYFHDKKENEIKNLGDQVSLVQDKYKFLYELYQEVSQLKNQFRRQLVGSRDSFGRIFNIARELDTLEEEEVIFKALNVLEEVMDNQYIAIYSISPANSYARLEIYSSGLGGQVAKSLNLKEYPELMESIDKGEIFQNNRTLPEYPAYFVPIKNDRTTVAAVVIWSATFEQFSLYYYNLLKVVCGLIQSSINRVALFTDANASKLYVPNTRILQPVPFREVLKVKDKMKKNKLGDYFLVMVDPTNLDGGSECWEILYTQLMGETRAEDYVGLLEDGNCYILFSQADSTNASGILYRLAQRGVSCQPMTDTFALSLDRPAGEASYKPQQQVN